MKKSYDNGVPKEIGTYKLSNDKLALVKKTYFYNNGQNKEEGYYLIGKKHGIWNAWYKNGNKKSETTFLNGKSDGKSTVWSPDGKESFELIWKRGKKFDGIWTNWSISHIFSLLYKSVLLFWVHSHTNESISHVL